MKIRIAYNDDFEQIKRIVTICLNEFGFDFQAHSSESDLLNIEDTYNSNSGIFLVGVIKENEIVSMGGIIKDLEFKFKIRKIYVVKSYRGNGYGKQIINTLFQIAKDRGGKEIVLETSSRMKLALKMYRSIGFDEKQDKIASPRCDIKMTKRI